jgi:hypothetical protein
VPNFDTKLISLYKYTVETHSYFESVVADIFINVIASSVKLGNMTQNTVEKIALMIRKLYIMQNSGHLEKYVADLSPD